MKNNNLYHKQNYAFHKTDVYWSNCTRTRLTNEMNNPAFQKNRNVHYVIRLACSVETSSGLVCFRWQMELFYEQILGDYWELQESPAAKNCVKESGTRCKLDIREIWNFFLKK